MNAQQGLNPRWQTLQKALKSKIPAYFRLIKSKQTLLLVLTGWSGFSSAACPFTEWKTALAVMGSLFLAISGCTAFNMVIDRHIDARMERTKGRPLPSGELTVKEVLFFAGGLSLLGLGWSVLLYPQYGLVVLTGLFTNVVIYSLLLKRTTCFSILFGGIAGGMPVLAGRVLGVGSIDAIGILLATAILLWIPIHIMTFNIKYSHDYRKAGIPTFPSKYGEDTTRVIIALSTSLASLSIILAAYFIGMTGYRLISLILLSIALVTFAFIYAGNPSPKLDAGLFKAASVYMMGSMLLLGLI